MDGVRGFQPQGIPSPLQLHRVLRLDFKGSGLALRYSVPLTVAGLYYNPKRHIETVLCYTSPYEMPEPG
jgi:hypothetical protein